MGVACSTHGGEVHKGFYWGNLRKRGHLEERGADVTIILRWIFSKLGRGHGMD